MGSRGDAPLPFVPNAQISPAQGATESVSCDRQMGATRADPCAPRVVRLLRGVHSPRVGCAVHNCASGVLVTSLKFQVCS